ncbi:MAG: ThiF family adenylyltransferase, partial [Imperialibacter sp.]
SSTIFNDKLLGGKRVTIIGLGALGSEVGKSLARNAVGHFNLFDNDTFEIGNSVRHAADLFYIGENKVEVVKQLIQRSNPNITVNSYCLDVLDDNGQLEKSLLNSDLCLVLTGEDSVDYLLNDKYITNFHISLIFARVSAGGLSGSVQIVNHNSSCLRCLSKRGLDYLPKPKTDIQYSELKPEYGSCSAPAVPGSEIDTKEVALQVSRVALQVLLANENANYSQLLGSQYYWHGPFGSSEQPPFTWEIKDYPKDKVCSICSQ